MSKLWFTSDNHFSHKNIHRFCPKTRPDADFIAMDEAMIRRWNEQVAPEDTVWALGDFFFCNPDRALTIIRRLNGHKNLVYGNHDQTIRNSVVRAYFESIHEYKELRHEGKQLILFHYPIYEWNKMHHGAYHLHGHIHDRLSGVPGRILNVCVDSPTFSKGDYSLYSFEEIQRVAEQRPIRTHHNAD